MSRLSASKSFEKSAFSFMLFGLLVLLGLGGCSSGGSSSSDEPTVSIAAASVAEGNSGDDTHLAFTITSSKASDVDITLTYATSDGTATADSDYEDTSGSVIIPAGDTSITLMVPIIEDSDVEADETLTLTLSAASGASLGTAVVTGTILDDDEDPAGFYDSASVTVKQSDNTTDRIISDLQGMVANGRFILMSDSEVLLYDGAITTMSGATYTATVDVYEDGVLIADSVVASGTITTASSFTVDLTGTGAANGSMALTYSLNNAESNLSRLQGNGAGWQGSLNGVDAGPATIISDSGDLSLEGNANYNPIPAIPGCNISMGSVLPVTGINVYTVTLTLSGCKANPSPDGDYTGFLTTQTSADDWLLLTFSNGSLSAGGLFEAI